MSISFINLAIPSTAARVALEVRFFQKQGVAAAKALTFGALDSFSLFLTQLSILIVTVGFGLTSLDFNLNSGDVSGAAKLAAVAIVAVVIGLIVVLAVRRLREWVFKQLAAGARSAARARIDQPVGPAVRRQPARADPVLDDARPVRARVRLPRVAREPHGDQRDGLVLRRARCPFPAASV